MKPSQDELNQAIQAAEKMRASDDDPQCLSKSLIYLYNRVEVLEKVFAAANQYMRFGQEEHEHAVLLQAIEAARRSEDQASQHKDHELGL